LRLILFDTSFYQLQCCVTDTYL